MFLRPGVGPEGPQVSKFQYSSQWSHGKLPPMNRLINRYTRLKPLPSRNIVGVGSMCRRFFDLSHKTCSYNGDFDGVWDFKGI